MILDDDAANLPLHEIKAVQRLLPPPYVYPASKTGSTSALPDSTQSMISSAPSPLLAHRRSLPSLPSSSQTDEILDLPDKPSNNLVIKATKSDISGGFFIDPNLESPEVSAQPIIGKKASSSRTKAKRKFNSLGSQINRNHALFETTRGNISLSLNVVGHQGAQAPARVAVRSKHGTVDIYALTIEPRRHLNLDVVTRTGDVNLFLPHTFCGPLHLRSQSGSLVFLPSISADMRVMTATDEEALVVINPQQLPSANPADWAADYAHITSVSGNLTVGRVGEEKRPPGPGLWERMTKRIFD